MVAGNHAKALTEYREMLAVDPADAEALAGVGIALLNLRRFAEAVSALERAQPPANRESMLNEDLAVAYVALGQAARGEALIRGHAPPDVVTDTLARVRERARRLSQR